MAGCGRLCLALALACLACGEGAVRPNVLLVTLDTTRADRLGPYGYEAPTTPHLDVLARESTVYEHAYSTSSWTLPAHASLFTGRFPISHGARFDPDGPLRMEDGIPGPAYLGKLRVRGLPEAERTLAEILRDAGWATGGIVGGPWLKRVFGLAQGFDHWDDEGVIDLARVTDGAVVSDRALAWIDATTEPFFLFLNYFDPHIPYRPHPLLASRLGEAGGLYEGEIAYADAQLGRVLDGLRERGLWERTLVVVTSDHGELFGEHGVDGHNRYLYEPLIRVPLLVKPPRAEPEPAREARPIQITEVPRIVLEAVGLEAPAPSATGSVYAEVYPPHGDGGDWRAWLEGDHKLLWSSRGAHRLHDLAADAGERENLADADPERLRAMQTSLERFVADLPKPAPAGEGDAGRVDPETVRALQSLGYLE